MTGGPLVGLKVLELAGVGPAPHAAMVLADLGADVVRVERTGGSSGLLPQGTRDQVLRGRRCVEADLATPEGRDVVVRLAGVADVLLEGMRPGVAERLGIGPADCRAHNERLVYARMTGWGQTGPMADRAGHDITYLAVTGVLHAMGRAGRRPAPPLNLVADYGGGSMFLVAGVLAALVERSTSGRGQVVDVAMVEGVGVLSQLVWSLRGAGLWSDERESNLLDGAAPFYDTYACADGRWVAVGAIEPRFFAMLLEGLGLDPAAAQAQHDRAAWPHLREMLSEAFATRARDEWAAVFESTDACVAPVLTFEEATAYPQLVERASFQVVDGVVQPSPAPRFSRTPVARPTPPPVDALDPESVLGGWGLPERQA